VIPLLKELSFDHDKPSKPRHTVDHVSKAWNEIREERTWFLMWKELQRAKKNGTYRDKAGKFN